MFDRFRPVTGLTGPVYRYRTPAVRPVRSENETLLPAGPALKHGRMRFTRERVRAFELQRHASRGEQLPDSSERARAFDFRGADVSDDVSTPV